MKAGRDRGLTTFSAPGDRAIYSIAVSASSNDVLVGQQNDDKNSPTLSAVSIEDGTPRKVVERTINYFGTVSKVIASPSSSTLAYVIQRASSFEAIARNSIDETSVLLKKDARPFMQSSMSFSSDGKVLMVGGQELCLFDTRAFGLKKRINPYNFGSDLRGDSVITPSAAMSPDGRLAAIGGHRSNVVTIVDLEAEKEARALDGPFKGVRQIEFSPIQNYVAAIDFYGRGLFVWDLKTGERHLPDIFNEVMSSVWSIRFDPAKPRLAVGYLRSFVSLFSVESGDELLSDSVHKGRVNDVAFSPSGDKLLSGAEDGSIVIRMT